MSDDEFEFPEGTQLLFDGASGIYIPQMFAEVMIRENVENVTAADWAILEKGPEDEQYWDTWEYVLDNAVIAPPTSELRYRLYQDGDLWMVPDPDE
jgi:hypothetical protein